MINNVKGVMAGIGDMLNDVNVIEPGFDARVYRYIIGKDCIIEGLEMSGNTLSAGICIGQGYRGYLPTSCEIGTIYDYIYAHFKVHHDRDIEDEFWIECTKSSTVVQNDILHNAGDYWLLLYQKVNGKWQKRIDDIKYPLRSQHSDDTMRVVEHGVLENGVTAVTQEVGDKTDKVATTEFVQNQIKKDINFDNYEAIIKANNQNVAKINLSRKSKYVVGIYNQTVKPEIPGFITFDNFDIEIPDGYLPVNDIYLPTSFVTKYYGTDELWLVIFKIFANTSNISVAYLRNVKTAAAGVSYGFHQSNIGYETN